MSIINAQPITLNVVDASPFARDVWSKRAQGIHGLCVEVHTEAPSSPDRLAQGLWALVLASFPLLSTLLQFPLVAVQTKLFPCSFPPKT